MSIRPSLLGGLADAEERGNAARRFLKAFSEPRADDDRPAMAALRVMAQGMAAKDVAQLLHDELGACFEPQAFADVVAAAAPHGLRFLNDAEPAQLAEGLPDEPRDEAGVVRAVQSGDFARMCLFHKTLFVRDAQSPARSPVLAQLRDLYMSARCERIGADSFTSSAGATFTISDPRLAGAVAAAADAWPGRLKVGDLIDDEPRLGTILRLFLGQGIVLHSRPFAGTLAPGSHPRASSLTRTLMAIGDQWVFTLDHRPMLLDDPTARAFLALLDGVRDRRTIAADWAAAGFGGAVSVEQALARFARFSLLLA